MEVGRVWAQAGEQVVEEGGDEVFDVGVVEPEGAAGRLRAVLVVRLLVVCDAQARVGLVDADVAGHVDLQKHLDAAGDAVLLDVLDGLRRVGEAGGVAALFGKLGKGRDLERPGLGVGDVQVYHVHLVHGQAVNGPFDVVDGEPVPAEVEDHAAVRKSRRILDRYGCLLGVKGVAGAVLEEELGEGLEAADKTGRGDGLDGRRAICVEMERVRLVDLASEGLEDGGVVLSGLRNGQGRDFARAVIQGGLKVGSRRVQHPRHKTMFKNGS